jgi:hypothetical protein
MSIVVCFNFLSLIVGSYGTVLDFRDAYAPRFKRKYAFGTSARPATRLKILDSRVTLIGWSVITLLEVIWLSVMDYRGMDNWIPALWTGVVVAAFRYLFLLLGVLNPAIDFQDYEYDSWIESLDLTNSTESKTQPTDSQAFSVHYSTIVTTLLMTLGGFFIISGAFLEPVYYSLIVLGSNVLTELVFRWTGELIVRWKVNYMVLFLTPLIFEFDEVDEEQYWIVQTYFGESRLTRWLKAFLSFLSRCLKKCSSEEVARKARLA